MFSCTCDVFSCLAEFHLSGVDSKLKGADGLCHIGIQWTDIHKHTSLEREREIF